jgi:hypothetical protein
MGRTMPAGPAPAQKLRMRCDKFSDRRTICRRAYTSPNASVVDNGHMYQLLVIHHLIRRRSHSVFCFRGLRLSKGVQRIRNFLFYARVNNSER